MKTNNTIAPGKPLTAALLRNIDGYWRAANYLSVGQIYLYDNPPLKLPHIKPRLLGHQVHHLGSHRRTAVLNALRAAFSQSDS